GCSSYGRAGPNAKIRGPKDPERKPAIRLAPGALGRRRPRASFGRKPSQLRQLARREFSQKIPAEAPRGFEAIASSRPRPSCASRQLSPGPSCLRLSRGNFSGLHRGPKEGTRRINFEKSEAQIAFKPQ